MRQVRLARAFPDLLCESLESLADMPAAKRRFLIRLIVAMVHAANGTDQEAEAGAAHFPAGYRSNSERGG
jgi:hypothetical protein